jgi:hypothetical protein
VANRDLFRTRTPERPGGGTVDYVAGPHRDDVDYVSRLAEREEGGTPAIVGDIRAGLAFVVKAMAGPEAILRHEIEIARYAAERLARHPNIRVLGPAGLPRLAIVPVEIEGIHHELASALLDHLFGIQNRAGCSCAGPYGHRLLGIDPAHSTVFRRHVRQGVHGIKPGWVRLSLPWYFTPDDLEFVLSAVEFVATHAEDFVPTYRFGWRNGVWSHVDRPDVDPDLPEMAGESLLDASGGGDSAGPVSESRLAEERRRYVEEARDLASRLRRRWQEQPPEWNPSTGDPELDSLVWFRYVHAVGLHDAETASSRGEA